MAPPSRRRSGYPIFAEILDEQQSKRLFFVSATERNTPEGQARIAGRIRRLFADVKTELEDVLDGNERLEPNDRALAYVASQLARFDLLATWVTRGGTPPLGAVSASQPA